MKSMQGIRRGWERDRRHQYTHTVWLNKWLVTRGFRNPEIECRARYYFQKWLTASLFRNRHSFSRRDITMWIMVACIHGLSLVHCACQYLQVFFIYPLCVQLFLSLFTRLKHHHNTNFSVTSTTTPYTIKLSSFLRNAQCLHFFLHNDPLWCAVNIILINII